MLGKIKEALFQAPVLQKPLRLWPGVVIVILMLLMKFGLPVVVSGSAGGSLAMLSGLLGGVLLMVWWAFFSRAPRFERWGGVLLMIAALVVIGFLNHKSLATGMMGLMFPMYAMPILSVLVLLWALAYPHLPAGSRRVSLLVVVLLACAPWTLVRSNGITGEGSADFSWRWAPTAEEQLLAEAGDEVSEMTATAEEEYSEADWPGFRGPNRDSIVRGTNIATDWSALPPAKLWSRKIGPGCSSFAVKGPLLYTQEQRGKYEMVTCYNLGTGKFVWKHRDKERFWDSHAGAGPRSTPTLNGDHVYTFGPTGILNALNAQDGSKVWSRNVGTENQVKIPIWALTSSPLVAGEVVIVAVEGILMAFDRATGEPRWRGPDGGKSYSSPHLATIADVTQVVQMSSTGAVSLNPVDGSLLWVYAWPKGERIVQPALMGDGELLVASGEGMAVRRIAVSLGPEGWTTEEKWTSPDLKPTFNDFVVHKGHVYGFDAPTLVSIDVEEGKRNWRGGRYGGGQLMLLADQDLLLVISEQGDLALVRAMPDSFSELARIPAIEGRVWNHPVLVGDILLVRNAQEMVAYRLPLVSSVSKEP